MDNSYLKLIDAGKRAAAQHEVNKLIVGCEAFKIGKTGQTRDERLSEYGDEYTNMEFVYTGSREQVDAMEYILIEYFSLHHKCENIKDGLKSNHDNMKEGAPEYHVYVVWR